jgi:predicted DNA-binding ArsR family transcriptional regulator
MKYFQTFPQVATTDYNGNTITLTNLMVRSELIPSLAKNPALFYQYDIQDGDTPEIIAEKYYGDPYRYWIVLYGNQIIDPQWQWPMSAKLFSDYLYDKYSQVLANIYSVEANTITYSQVLAYTQSTVNNYFKVLTTVDNQTSNTTISKLEVDSVAFTNIVPTSNTCYFPNGTSVTFSVSPETVYIYDYEVQQNENNRSISLVNSAFVPQFESQLLQLMSQ